MGGARLPDQPGVCRRVRVRPHRREKTVDRDGRVRVRDVEVPLEEWSVCLPEHHPGYVTWTSTSRPASGCART